MESITSMRREKSVRLSKDDWKGLKTYRKEFTTSTNCAESIGISRTVLQRILIVGSGSPENISKVILALLKPANK